MRETDPKLLNHNSLQETPLAERPQERLERLGARALSDAELLAMLLRSGSAKVDVLTLARRMVAEAGSLSGLLRYGAKDFARFPGVGQVKALQLVTVMEVARRVLAQGQAARPVLEDAAAIAEMMRSHALGVTGERAWVLCLDQRSRLLAVEELSVGGITGTTVDPRDVFRLVFRHRAARFALVHNHPSGDPTPSVADIQMTRKVRQGADLLELGLVDHVILGSLGSDPAGQGYASLFEMGVLT